MTRARGSSDLIVSSTRAGVTTLRMNMPARLNGWTHPMMETLKASFAAAARDEACQALILTGTDPYYCAGVNLGAAVKLAHPRVLHAPLFERSVPLLVAQEEAHALAHLRRALADAAALVKTAAKLIGDASRPSRYSRLARKAW